MIRKTLHCAVQIALAEMRGQVPPSPAAGRAHEVAQAIRSMRFDDMLRYR